MVVVKLQQEMKQMLPKYPTGKRDDVMCAAPSNMFLCNKHLHGKEADMERLWHNLNTARKGVLWQEKSPKKDTQKDDLPLKLGSTVTNVTVDIPIHI